MQCDDDCDCVRARDHDSKQKKRDYASTDVLSTHGNDSGCELVEWHERHGESRRLNGEQPQENRRSQYSKEYEPCLAGNYPLPPVHVSDSG